jgi:S1-C subfamily serine protease
LKQDLLMPRFISSATLLAVVLVSSVGFSEQQTKPTQTIQASAPITAEEAGKSGAIAASSVMRVICQATSMGGTGFLHKSGRVITAAHVPAGCQPNQVVLVTATGKTLRVSSVSADSNLDLAVLQPSTSIPGPSLQISARTQIPVGAQVSTWGFPAGYSGVLPLLTVGYLAGIDQVQTSAGRSSPRWVVNAAFNSGNSGGPVLSTADGSVVGVVSSKLAPIPPLIESALEALANQQSGFVYTKTMPDGTKANVSEGQVVGEVLKYLRSQTQLVLGHAVTSEELRAFLKARKIDP